MALSSISTISSLATTKSTFGILPNFSNATLSTTSFTTNTRTDAGYGLITVVASGTSGDNASFGIVRMLDNNSSSQWQSISDYYSNYFNEAGTSVSIPPLNTGGEYSDSNNTLYTAGSGQYYGIKLSGVQTRFSTTYLDFSSVSQIVYGAYITVFFNSTTKAQLKSMTIGGNTSWNWDDLPREIVILGSDDNTNWNLIQDASNFGSLSPWSVYMGMTGANGYKNSSGTAIPNTEYTYNITTSSKYRYLRFVIKRLIRGRVLGIFKFNLSYDIFIG